MAVVTGISATVMDSAQVGERPAGGGPVTLARLSALIGFLGILAGAAALVFVRALG
jgi:hypothetical protein